MLGCWGLQVYYLGLYMPNFRVWAFYLQGGACYGYDDYLVWGLCAFGPFCRNVGFCGPRLVLLLPCPLTWVCLLFVLFFGTLLQEVYLLYMQYFFCLFLILVRPFVQFCSLLTQLYDILRGNSHWPYSLTKYFTFTIVWTRTCLVPFPGPISFASSVSWLLWTEPTGWILHQLCKGFIRPVARIGSGDPVRVLCLYTTNTLDGVCSIYCWDICTTCRYQSMCYSTGASGPTALSVCSWLCLVTNWLNAHSVLYCTVPFMATCVDAIGTVFWDRPVLCWPGKALILVAKLLLLP